MKLDNNYDIFVETLYCIIILFYLLLHILCLLEKANSWHKKIKKFDYVFVLYLQTFSYKFIMKKFAHIKKVFKHYKEPEKYPSGYEEVKVWYIKRGIRLWLNDKVDGKLIQIRLYSDLKKKIQDMLKLWGYADVSEIPADIEITCE